MRFIVSFIVLWCLLTLSPAVLAVAAHSDIGQVSEGIGTQLGPVAKMLLGFAILAGLTFTGAGLMKLRSAQEVNSGPGNTTKAAVILILVGGLMTTVGGVVFMAKDTMLGTNSSFEANEPRGHLDKFIGQ